MSPFQSFFACPCSLWLKQRQYDHYLCRNSCLLVRCFDLILPGCIHLGVVFIVHAYVWSSFFIEHFHPGPQPVNLSLFQYLQKNEIGQLYFLKIYTSIIITKNNSDAFLVFFVKLYLVGWPKLCFSFKTEVSRQIIVLPLCRYVPVAKIQFLRP
jgi:hypothetical protein